MSNSGGFKKIRLVTLMLNKYPGLSRKKAMSILREMKQRNKGTLIGLKVKKFQSLFSKIHKERIQQAEKERRAEIIRIRRHNKTCPICYKLFRQKYGKDRHIKMVHEKKSFAKKKRPATYTCKVCGKKYAHEVSLNRHAKSHKESEVSIACEECGKTFTRRDNFWKHRERVHNLVNINVDEIMQKKDKKCNMCNKKFTSQSMLLAHVSLKACSMQLDAQEKFKCNFCDSSYAYKSALNRHRKTKHEDNIKVFKCKKCKQTFSYKSTFSRHMLKYHQ